MQFPTEHSAVKCAGGCGFYGSPATDNYCSVCYKRRLSDRSNNPHPTSTSTTHSSSSARPCTTTIVSSSSAMGATSTADAAINSNNQSQRVEHTSSDTDENASSACPNSEHNNISSESCQISRTSAGPMAQGENSLGTSGDATIKEESKPSTSTVSLGNCAGVVGDIDFQNGGEKQLPPVQAPPRQCDPSRCYKCNKRVGLLGFKCRCGVICCRPHLHAEEHDCTFNYQEFGRQVIETRNPKLVTEKFDRM